MIIIYKMENVINSNEALLQTIATNTANINVNVGDVEVNTQELEVLVGATNGLLTTMDGVQDNALTKLGEIETTNNANQVLLGSIDADTNNIKVLLTTLDGVQDNALTKLTNVETLITTLDGVQDNVLTKLGEIDTAIDTIDTVLDNSLTKLGEIETTNNANQVLLGTIDEDTNAIKGLLTTLDGVQDNALTKLGEIETTNNANQVLLGSIDADTNDIKGLLTTLDGVQDNALTKLTNVETLITTLDGVQDNALTKLGEIDTAIDTIDSVLDASLVKHTANETLITAMSAKLPASLGQKANANCISTCRSSTSGAYDLSARTTVGTPSTTTKLLCDAQGHLQVDVLNHPTIADVSGLSTHAKQDTIIGHIDGLETLIGATNTLLGTADAVLDASLVKQTNIETLITTLDGVQDNVLTKLGEIETTNNANQVLLGTIDSDTDAIKTAVELIDDAIHAEDAAHSSGDKGIPCLFVRQDSHSDLAADGDYMCPTINANGEIRVTSGSASTTMTVDTLMSNVGIAANATTNSSVFTKPKDVSNFAVLVSSASGSGGFSLRKSKSVDGTTYIEDNTNINAASSRQLHISESLEGFKFYRYAITNVELGSVNHTIKVCY